MISECIAMPGCIPERADYTDGQHLCREGLLSAVVLPVSGGCQKDPFTWPEHILLKAELILQISAEKKRKAEERDARVRQLQERRAAEDAEDRAAAQQRATELRNAVAYHREGQPLGWTSGRIAVKCSSSTLPSSALKDQCLPCANQC